MDHLSKDFRKANGKIYATVTYDGGKNIIQDVWQGTFGSKENFETVLLYILEQIRKYKISFWLADLRNLKGTFDQSSEWIVSYIMPEVIKAGLQKEAIVVPKDVFARISTKDTASQIQNFKLRQFDSMLLAIEWLAED